MDRTYWEKIAPDYNEEIFDVLQQDKKGIIRAAIRAVSGPDKTVIDAGCAIGKWIPVLAPLFNCSIFNVFKKSICCFIVE